jgi:uncharacterized protein YkwD
LGCKSNVFGIGTAAAILVATSTPSDAIQERVAKCVCSPGYVQRLADEQDFVCVTPASKALVDGENAAIKIVVRDGRSVCNPGTVWRDAFDGDGRCVVPSVRDRVHQENRQHVSHVTNNCTATTTTTSTTPTPGGAGLTGADEQAMLSATNASRGKHCAPALTWSPQLAAAAQAWVNKCTFAHDPQRGQTGENLAWGTSLSPQQAEQLWYNEVSQYNFAAPVYSSAVGHFTQLVWKATTQVGCAKAACGGQVLLSCRFAPPGNMNVVVGPNVTAQQAQQSLMQNVSNVCR